jgi:L-ascorbate metabolism protein UlaG (beta-lactamase superfamily)
MVLRVAALVLLAAMMIAPESRGPRSDVNARVAGSTTVNYFGHCCFQIVSPGGVHVLIDPYESLSEPNQKFIPAGFPVYSFPTEEVSADVVLVTHVHTDHNYGGLSDIQSRWGSNVPVLVDGDLTLGDIHAVGLAGKHSSRNGNLGIKNVIWSIDVGMFRIVHWGDNAVPSDEQMRSLANDGVRPGDHVDLLMLPIDSGCHLLSYEDVDKIRKTVNPKMLTPMHYVIPELQQGVAGMDIDRTDWMSLGWGPLRPWLKGRQDVVVLDSNQLVLTDVSSVQEGKVVVFKWPVPK